MLKTTLKYIASVLFKIKMLKSSLAFYIGQTKFYYATQWLKSLSTNLESFKTSSL